MVTGLVHSLSVKNSIATFPSAYDNPFERTSVNVYSDMAVAAEVIVGRVDIIRYSTVSPAEAVALCEKISVPFPYSLFKGDNTRLIFGIDSDIIYPLIAVYRSHRQGDEKR